jgi:hypothetical protein
MMELDVGLVFEVQRVRFWFNDLLNQLIYEMLNLLSTLIRTSL